MATVTKRELVSRISSSAGFPKAEVHEVVEQIILEITESLSKGDDVVFRNFGSFQTGVNQPKIGRNPKHPEVEIRIPARRVVRFKAGKLLKEMITKSGVNGRK